MNRTYDVFISCKNSDENGNLTKDSVLAEKLYQFLIKKGIKAFLSNVELEFIGTAQYAKAIDDALDASGVLVAVGCSKNNLDSRWVRYEWESFLNDIRSGVKPDAEVFVFFDDMKIYDLPRALRLQQAFCASDVASYERIYNFIYNSLIKLGGHVEADEPGDLPPANANKPIISCMDWEQRRIWCSVTGNYTENGFSISQDGETLSIRNDYYEIASVMCYLQLQPNSDYRFSVDVMMTDYERYSKDNIDYYPIQTGGAGTIFQCSKGDEVVEYATLKHIKPVWATLSWRVTTNSNITYYLCLTNGSSGNACKGIAHFKNLRWEKSWQG